MLNTLVTYLDKCILGQLELMLDLYCHFGSDAKWDTATEAHKKEKASNKEMMDNHLLEAIILVLSLLCYFTPILYSTLPRLFQTLVFY